MRPMLATSGDHVPPGEEWVHEVKWDGIRLVAECRDGKPTFRTRNDNDVTMAWPEIAGDTPTDELIVDGEVIALNEAGLPDFRVLAERMHRRDPQRIARFAADRPATFMVFDVLRADGRDLVDRPWTERREVLESLDLGSWQVPQAYDDGAMLYSVTRDQGLEGIVSKRRRSRYRPGERTKDWLKFAHRFRDSYVVGGWRPQVGTADRLAAVLVGEPTENGLMYRGRVGSGIGAKESRMLRELVDDSATSPFADEVPREDANGTHWVKPRVVVEVERHGKHEYERLRQPSFIAVRSDVEAGDL